MAQLRLNKRIDLTGSKRIGTGALIFPPETIPFSKIAVDDWWANRYMNDLYVKRRGKVVTGVLLANSITFQHLGNNKKTALDNMSVTVFSF